ncbi:hypothetical protein FRC03_007747 [Tulasnella sp. 419]|nr:hypothetical protein FRC03_007747 [Tulasnella sp. 419]
MPLLVADDHNTLSQSSLWCRRGVNPLRVSTCVVRYRSSLGDGAGALKLAATGVEEAYSILPLRYTNTSDFATRLRKALRREMKIWQPLDHPNIVPFLGFSIPPDVSPSLISPWHTNGNVMKYIGLNPLANRTEILYNLICGLAYLHSLGIVHGDIKAENALVDIKGTAKWCDFGMSHFLDGTPGRTGATSSYIFRGGTIPFLSPEQVTESESRRKTPMMDMWSFGCLMAQVMTAQLLYPECRNDYQVLVQIIQGTLPMNTLKYAVLRPDQTALWMIVDNCWRRNPNARPSAAEALGRISKLIAPSRILVHYHVRYDVTFSPTPTLQNFYDIHGAWSRVPFFFSN